MKLDAQEHVAVRRYPASFMDGSSARLHQVEFWLDSAAGTLCFDYEVPALPISAPVAAPASVADDERGEAHEENPVSGDLLPPESEPLVISQRWPLADIHLDGRHGAKDHHISYGEALLSIEDPAAVEALRAVGIAERGLWGNQKRLRFAVGLGGAVALCLAGIWFAMPAISQFIAHRVPLKYERMLGVQMESIFESQYCDDSQAEDILTRYADYLGHEREGTWEVHIMDGDMPNAFAMPGGIIVFTRGLLEQSDDPSTILGVMAHEIEHVQQRHVLASVIRAVLLTAFWSAAFGDFSGIAIDPGTATEVLSLSFSRDVERSADAGGLERLDMYGIPAQGMVSFFEQFKEHEIEDLQFLSTHPPSAERIAYFEAHDAQAGERSLEDVEFVAEDDLEILNSACSVRDNQ